MLVVKNLEVFYGNFKAISNVNLELRSGSLVAVIGPNGAGKSTLLKAIAGMLSYNGTITIEDVEVRELSPWERVKYVTYVPATIATTVDITIGDLLLSTEGVDLGLLENYVRMFDLGSLLNRKIWEVSTGELERALIVRGLSRFSKVYLFDELLSHIDLRYQIRVLKHLRTLVSAGRLVLVASNQLSPLLNFTDYVVAIKAGKLLAAGRTDEVICNELLKELYGVKAEIVKHRNIIDVVPIDEVKTELNLS